MKEWENLYNTVKSRKTERIENSYTNYLFDKGKEKILKKKLDKNNRIVKYLNKLTIFNYKKIIGKDFFIKKIFTFVKKIMYSDILLYFV